MYLLWGFWFMALSRYKDELQSGYRELHVALGGIWVFQWCLEAFWGAEILSAYGGSEPWYDKRLFVHSDKPCAHSTQEFFIVCMFIMSLAKMVLEKVSLRFDFATTEYRQSFKYKEATKILTKPEPLSTS